MKKKSKQTSYYTLRS